MKEKLAKFFTKSNGIFTAFFMIAALGFLATPVNSSNSLFFLLALLSFVLNPVVMIFDIIASVIGEGRTRRWNIIFLILDALLEFLLYYAIILSVG